jgi:hypothetical protein
MIKVTVERRYGSVTVKSRVTAPSIERAMELAGGDASLVLPIEPDAFFQASEATEGVENVHELGRKELAEMPA